MIKIEISDYVHIYICLKLQYEVKVFNIQLYLSSLYLGPHYIFSFSYSIQKSGQIIHVLTNLSPVMCRQKNLHLNFLHQVNSRKNQGSDLMKAHQSTKNTFPNENTVPNINELKYLTMNVTIKTVIWLRILLDNFKW